MTEIQCFECGETRNVQTGNSKDWYEQRYPLCMKCAGMRRRSDPQELGRRFVWRTYRRNARQRGIEFGLTSEEFISMIESTCHYCGGERSNVVNMDDWWGYREDAEKYYYMGIDRVDDLEGYIVDNCVPCCQVCNRAKYHMSLFDFYSWINKLVKKRRTI